MNTRKALLWMLWIASALLVLAALLGLLINA